VFVLEINDAEIALTRDGEPLYREPGVALVNAERVVFGREALASSRLHPQQSHNEFWQRLNADPVTPAARGAANQADLVYLQLRDIRASIDSEGGSKSRTSVVVAVPATITPGQLAVLLGIAAEAGFEVRTLVDAAVAAACLQPLQGPCLALDVSLHRSVVTHLEIDDEESVVRRGSVDEIPAAGFAALVEGWVDVVADRFVDGTRFDPLRIAETEQQVFDQVIAGIQAGDAEMSIEVVHDEVARRVTVSRTTLAQKSQQRYELLARSIGEPATLAASHRIRRLPGLVAFLQDAGHKLVALPDAAAALGIAKHAALIEPGEGSGGVPGSGARLITSLPTGAADIAATKRRSPTHLLCGNLALPLDADTNARDHPGWSGGGGAFRVRRGSEGFSVVPNADAAVALNGTPIDFEHPAHAGDSVVSGGNEFKLITVLEKGPGDAESEA